MFESPRYGFRFSSTDGIVLLLTGVVSWFLWPYFESLTLMLPVVIGHFFLFCNVFRIHRNLELIWSAVFMVNVSYWFLANFEWWLILSCQSPITVVLIAIEMRSSRYHGMLCKMINKQVQFEPN